MYLMLGEIILEPIDVTDFSETQSAVFAEHSVLKGKPRLQAMGEGLTELRFACRLHHKVGGVEHRYQSLLKAKSKQNALALIWGQGKLKGNFVITDISSTTLFTDKHGNVLCRELDISLKEFVGEIKNGILGAALNVGNGSLLGSFLPNGVVYSLNSAKEAINKGIQIYNQGKRIVDEVQNTVSIMKQFANDPATALAYLPNVLNNIDGALGSFGELTGMSETLNSVRSALPAVSQFTQDVANIYTELDAIKQDITNTEAGTNWTDWFPSVNQSMESISDSTERLSLPVTQMTAWVVLREDEEKEVLNDSSRT